MSKVGDVAAAMLVPPAVMSCFLPSPSTAYDKASGKISSGPASLRLLKRGEVIGAVVAIAVAGALSLVAADELGPAAAWVFVGALVLLAIFLFEFERAFALGKRVDEA